MTRHYLTVVMALTMFAANSSLAFGATNAPYFPSASEIGGLQDATVNFSGTQLSTHTITPTATGLSSAASFEVGTGGAFGGETFSRVVFQGFNLPGDLSAFDSIGVSIVSSIGVSARPYIQTGENWDFSESVDVPWIPENTPTTVFLEFDDLVEFGDPFDATFVRAWGFQIFGPSPPVGESVSATIAINVIPEPTGLALLGLASFGLAFMRRLR